MHGTKGGGPIPPGDDEAGGAPAPTRPSSGQRHGITPGAVALRQILDGVAERDETIRVGCIGNTRVGKTEMVTRLLSAWQSVKAGTCVLDCKANHRFDFLLKHLPPEERARESCAHLTRKPYPAGTRVVIARANVFAGRTLDPDEWQWWAWSMAGRKLRTLVYCDDAVPDMFEFMQFKPAKDSATKRAYVQGGEHGISQAFSTTDVDQVPVAVMASLSHLCVFKTAGTGLIKLRERNYTIGVPPGLIENLAGRERPPHERGEFVLLASGEPWDGRVYKF